MNARQAHCNIRHPELRDAKVLFEYLLNEKVRKYSRIKPDSFNDMQLAIHYLKETEGDTTISRVITNKGNEPLGMIILWGYNKFKREGFLATWLAEKHWGQGYNDCAKMKFLTELFCVFHIKSVYVAIREYNHRSIAAILKQPYVLKAHPKIEHQMRVEQQIEDTHILFEITNDIFLKNLDGLIKGDSKSTNYP